MKREWVGLGLVLGSALAVAAVDTGQTVDALLSRGFPSDKPGCAVHILKDGASVFHRAYGSATSRGKALSTDTRFLLASTTKPIVALGILRLREILLSAGESDLLDRRMDQIFRSSGESFADPAFVAVTVRDLLDHTSGLGGVYPLLPFFARQHLALSDANLVQALFSRKPAGELPPGKYYYYSNAGFALLGGILERLSGQSLDVYLRTAFFGPLRMKHTSIRHPATYLSDPTVARGHELVLGALVEAPLVDPLSGTLGDGGMMTSSEDMGTWAKAIDAIEAGRSPLLRAESLKLAFQSRQTPAAELVTWLGLYLRDGAHFRVRTKDKSRYGLGWSLSPPVQPEPRSPSVLYEQWHGGYYGGYRAMFARARRESPHCQVTVILLCNRVFPDGSEWDVSPLSSKLRDLYCAN